MCQEKYHIFLTDSTRCSGEEHQGARRRKSRPPCRRRRWFPSGASADPTEEVCRAEVGGRRRGIRASPEAEMHAFEIPPKSHPLACLMRIAHRDHLGGCILDPPQWRGAGMPREACTIRPPFSKALGAATWRLTLDVQVVSQDRESTLDAVERISTAQRNESAQRLIGGSRRSEAEHGRWDRCRGSTARRNGWGRRLAGVRSRYEITCPVSLLQKSYSPFDKLRANGLHLDNSRTSA